MAITWLNGNGCMGGGDEREREALGSVTYRQINTV